MNIIRSLFVVIVFFQVFITQTNATPMNRNNALKHAQAANQAATAGDWDVAWREWAKAVVNADLGKLDDMNRAIFYFEYGRSAGVTCFFDIAEDYLNKAYKLDSKIGGPSFLSLVELFRLNLDQKKFQEAIDYFLKALPELERVNAPSESPAEFSKLLDEYAIALNATGNYEEKKSKGESLTG